jgi:hypothetical protein
MAYIVGQYNHNSASADDASFIDPIKTGTAKRRQNSGDMGVIGGSGLDPFSDECISDLNLVTSEYYYFRCQIKRMVEAQQFTVKLVNYDSVAAGSVEQYLKTVVVKGGDREEWVSVELIFHPVVQFDTILFQLQRTIEDYRTTVRYPKIVYQQLGTINSIIEPKIGAGIELLKIGVQSHPGLTMCINGEELHISRSGIFEIKNGVLPIKFFSVTNPAQEVNTSVADPTSVEGWKTSVNAQIEAIENDPDLTNPQKEARYRAINSVCYFNTPKKYVIDPFTLDYMYKD